MKRLSDVVAIQSVSAWTEEKYRNEIVKMVNHVKDVGCLHFILYYSWLGLINVINHHLHGKTHNLMN